MKIELFKYAIARPFAWFGLTHSFWNVHINTIIQTWLAMGILFGLIVIARRYIQRDLNPVAIAAEQSVTFFSDLCTEAFGHFRYDYFAFIASLFFFTLFCNMVGMLPFIEEPTNNLNTTFAIGIVSFLYVQVQKIKLHGIGGVLKEYFEPIFIMFPLHVIGELAKVVSMSFRLFGNILGGAIVVSIAVQAVGNYKEYFMIGALVLLLFYLIVKKWVNLKEHKVLNMICVLLLILVFFLPGLQLFFGVFEGVIQAFVVIMLTVTYLAMTAARHRLIQTEGLS